MHKEEIIARRARPKLYVALATATLAFAAVAPVAYAASPGQAVSLAIRAAHADGRAAPGATVIVTPLWQATDDVKRYGRAVGRAVKVGPDGRANLRLILTGAQREASRKNNDWITIALVMLDNKGNVVDITNTSRYLGSKADQRAQRAFLPNQNELRLKARPSERADVSALAGDPDVETLASCTYYWDVARTTDKYAQYGELHVDSDVKKGKITYGATADSNFDIMVKEQTPDQTYSVSGSVHVGNSESLSTGMDFGGLTNHHWALRTKFRYYDFHLYKDCLGGPYGFDTGASEIVAGEWLGGGSTMSNTVTQGPRYASNTFIYGRGGFWSRNSNYLVKWSLGAGAFGVSFGIQSGASTNVRYDYEFGTAKSTHYLFGNNGYPSVSSRVFQTTP